MCLINKRLYFKHIKQKTERKRKTNKNGITSLALLLWEMTTMQCNRKLYLYQSCNCSCSYCPRRERQRRHL